MIVKIVILFLIAMGVLAMFGRLRLPGRGGRGRLKTRPCPHCGRPRLGRGPCDCGGGDRG